jgi:hypothetical protein
MSSVTEFIRCARWTEPTSKRLPANNVRSLGPGVGKTHLAVAFGLQAVAAGYWALILTIEGRVGRLIRPAGWSGMCDDMTLSGVTRRASARVEPEARSPGHCR